jgi:hypothetical protein
MIRLHEFDSLQVSEFYQDKTATTLRVVTHAPEAVVND